MMVTIDKAGRVVIPKELRDRLGLDAESELEAILEADGIRLTPVRVPSRVAVDDDGWPVLRAVPGMAVTDSDVQRWRDADQR